MTVSRAEFISVWKDLSLLKECSSRESNLSLSCIMASTHFRGLTPAAPAVEAAATGMAGASSPIVSGESSSKDFEEDDALVRLIDDILVEEEGSPPKVSFKLLPRDIIWEATAFLM